MRMPSTITTWSSQRASRRSSCWSGPIRRRHRRAGNQVGARLQAAGRGRNRVEHLAVDDHRLPVADDVDDRRLAGDGDGFFERAELELGVDRRGEVAFEQDARRAGSVLKPAIVNVTVVRARDADRRCDIGRRRSVTALRTRSISAGLAASTVTPGSAAPDESLTTPEMAACASAFSGRNSAAAPSATHTAGFVAYGSSTRQANGGWPDVLRTIPA